MSRLGRRRKDDDLDSGLPGTPAGAPAGSGEIEKTFNDYFAAQGLPTAPRPFDGRSDYRAFILNGIPAGGLFTGAEVRKTAASTARHPPSRWRTPPARRRWPETATSASTRCPTRRPTPRSRWPSTHMLNGERGKGNFNTGEKVQERAAR